MRTGEKAGALGSAHQQHCDADLQQDPDDDDDVAIHEEHRAVVERPCERYRVVELGRKGERGKRGEKD